MNWQLGLSLNLEKQAYNFCNEGTCIKDGEWNHSRAIIWQCHLLLPRRKMAA